MIIYHNLTILMQLLIAISRKFSHGKPSKIYPSVLKSHYSYLATTYINNVYENAQRFIKKHVLTYSYNIDCSISLYLIISIMRDMEASEPK